MTPEQLAHLRQWAEWGESPTPETTIALLDLVDTLTKRLEAVRELADMWAATGDPATKERQAALKGAARRLYQVIEGESDGSQ